MNTSLTTRRLLTILTIATATLSTGCQTETPSAEAAPKSIEAADTAGSSLPQATSKKTGSRTKTRDISFDDLEFEIEKDADFDRKLLTPEIEALDGTPVKIYGFILPASVWQQTGFDRFVLIRDNQECCFGPGAYIYHNIQVEMTDGNTADFTVRPVAVEGKLQIQPWFAPDGKCYSVFHMTANRVGK